MSDSAEYRRNAQLCADLAETTHMPVDRQIWLRMQVAWLQLAAKEERQVPAAAG
jgi:hypothetical protein